MTTARTEGEPVRTPPTVTWIGWGLVVSGLLLLAHPFYIEPLLIYPGTNWTFLPLFHAAFTSLAVVTLVAGWVTIRTRKPTGRALSLFVAVTILFVPLYGIMIVTLVGTDGPSHLTYGIRRTFVGSLVVTMFLFGYGLTQQDRSVIGLAVLTPTVPLVMVLMEWRTSALLEPVLEGYFLLTGNPILGIPYLGTWLLLVATVIGVWTGIWGISDETANVLSEDSGEHSS